VFVTALTGFATSSPRTWQRLISRSSRLSRTVGESFISSISDIGGIFWMMLGTMWGMYVAAERWKQTRSGGSKG